MARVLVIDAIADIYWSMGMRQEHVAHVETGLEKCQLVQVYINSHYITMKGLFPLRWYHTLQVKFDLPV